MDLDIQVKLWNFFPFTNKKRFSGMKKAIIIALLFFAFGVQSQTSVNYISNITTLGNLDSDDYTEIKEDTYVSINPNEQTITFNSLKNNIIMRFTYFKKTDGTNRITYNMSENKWSVTDMVIQAQNNQLFITWLYAKPNNSIIMYGPLIKQ